MSAPDSNVAYIGLGSNLENPLQQLQQAIERLNGIAHTQCINTSHFYGSSAVGPGEQPDYVNAAACLHTKLSAIELLDALQAIENEQGRTRGELRWTPRTLDLDILLFNQDTISSQRLQVPHPRLAERHFVLQPLLDINPELILPNGDSIQELLNALSQTGLWRLAISARD